MPGMTHLSSPSNAPSADAMCEGEAAPEIQGARSPLTGRNTEVSLLADRWEQAQEGMGQVVLLTGEAGLGKSRLVETIRARVLAEASLIIDWRCSPLLRNSSLHPAAGFLERLLDSRPEESSAARFDRLAQYLDDCGLGRPEVVAHFARLLFLPPDARYPAGGLSPVRE